MRCHSPQDRVHLLVMNLAVLTLLWAVPLCASDGASDSVAAASAKPVAPKLVSVSVLPEKAILAGARGEHGIRVTGQFEDGGLRDITGECVFRTGDGAVVDVSEEGVVTSKGNGSAVVTATVNGIKGTAEFEIRDISDSSYNFRNDVLPVVESLGCNQMGCHGSPKGKKRLALSLFSAEPHGDYVQIADAKKKLIDLQSPGRSWLLLKATCEEDHGGADLTAEGEPEYNLLLDWIANSAPEGSKDDVHLESIEVFPRERTMVPGAKQRLLVEAYFSDGSMRDVTSLAWYRSSETAVTEVDKDGNAEVNAYGEAIILVRYGGLVTSSRVTAAQPVAVPFPNVPAYNRVDELVYNKLRSLNIIPSEVSSDAEFLRRVYLDVVGILPTAEEARTFLADDDPDKRGKLIDHLLERPEYADFYAVKWGDVLQINRAEPARLQDKGMWAYYRWLWNALDQNMPMDQFVRETLTARGSAYKSGPANFFRVGEGPQGMAEHASTAFLGVRLDCAHCHNHPFEQFTLDDNLGMAAFFSQVRSKRTLEQDEEVIYVADIGSVSHPDTKKRASPKYLAGEELAAKEKAAVVTSTADKDAADRVLRQKTAAAGAAADRVKADKIQSGKLVASKRAAAKLAVDQLTAANGALGVARKAEQAAAKATASAQAVVDQAISEMAAAKQAVADARAAVSAADAESSPAAVAAQKAATERMATAAAALNQARVKLTSATQTMTDKSSIVASTREKSRLAKADADQASTELSTALKAASDSATAFGKALNAANSEVSTATKQVAECDAIHRRAVAALNLVETTGDLRSQLVDWIVAPDNPYFARHMTNRVWWWLTGRGIIHEPDDFRSTNPPSNAELLDYLAEHFVQSGFDMKETFRLILNSRTYQASSHPNEWNKADRIHYSHYQLRRLSAEQLAEAISQVADVPEKYSGLPLGTRATQLPDVSMRSEFLDLFGRPKRATPVESERTCDTHIGQSLQMISSEYMARKLRDNNGLPARLAASDKPVTEAVDELYLTSLSRLPTDTERNVILAQPITKAQRREKFEDLLWVLMNTKEFLFNH